MTHLRKLMLEELERRNYAQTTIAGLPCPPETPRSLQSLLRLDKNPVPKRLARLLQTPHSEAPSMRSVI